jgi:glycosyltransferase involved in cell wall biosynthesis
VTAVNGSRADGWLILKLADVEATSGGVHNFMWRSGAEVEERGHSVQLVFADGLLPRLRHPGLRRLLVPWAIVAEVQRRVRSGQRPDVVEIHEPVAAAYCAMRRIGRLKLPPCVVISYGPAESRWRAQRERARMRGERVSWKSRVTVPLTLLPQSRYAFRHADHVLISSQDDADYVHHDLGVPRERIARADSAVDDSYFELRRSAAAGEELRLLFMATWIDRKGTPELAQAWKTIAEHEPSARLTVACTVVDRERVLADLTHHDRVSVRPRLTEPELKRLICEHDVFLLPAWFEGGAALASLQAAAAGMACVVTAIGGSTDVFRPQDPEADGALLVHAHSADDLVAAVRRLARDRPFIERLGARARERARAFSWQHTADGAMTAYQTAIKGDAR